MAAAAALATRRHASNTTTQSTFCEKREFLEHISSSERCSELRSQSSSHLAISPAHASTKRTFYIENVQKFHVENNFSTKNVLKCINFALPCKTKCTGKTNIISVCNANREENNNNKNRQEKKNKLRTTALKMH